MKILLSIFTPTYNRAHLLHRLFYSLKNQALFNFEWIIVDDGSIDNTEEIVIGFKTDAKFPITYLKKKNEGKHIAINIGVGLAKGELFFIVDSDDFLANSATQLIQDYYSQIKDKMNVCGLSFRRGYSETELIGTPYKFTDCITNIFIFRYKKNISGDMAEVYKTEIIRKFPFPKIDNEKFCPESLVWNRMGLRYNMLWTSHIIYVCEYLKGGLTDKITEIRIKSPQYATLYYTELSKSPVPLKIKIKSLINYWRFAYYLDYSFLERWRKVDNIYSVIALPLSLYFLLKDKKS